jgi:hypothetical protein
MPCISAVALAWKSANRLPLATMYLPLQACPGAVGQQWPAAGDDGLGRVHPADHRGQDGVVGAGLGCGLGRCALQQRAIMMEIISTWAGSSVPTSRIRSLYLPGIRQFQPWNRYCMATVISP